MIVYVSLAKISVIVIRRLIIIRAKCPTENKSCNRSLRFPPTGGFLKIANRDRTVQVKGKALPGRAASPFFGARQVFYFSVYLRITIDYTYVKSGFDPQTLHNKIYSKTKEKVLALRENYKNMRCKGWQVALNLYTYLIDSCLSSRMAGSVIRLLYTLRVLAMTLFC